MAMVKILMILSTIAIVFGSTMAANHTVGAPNGRWDDNTDLTTWAASQTFIVGDSLSMLVNSQTTTTRTYPTKFHKWGLERIVCMPIPLPNRDQIERLFSEDPRLNSRKCFLILFPSSLTVFVYTPNHDVLEVSKADYDSCQTTNSISTNGGGMTIIPLSSTGKRYFICGTSGHCASGMKLEVNTLATASPPPAVPPSASSPPVSAPTPKIAPKISPVSSPSPKNAPKISPATSPAANGPSSTTVETPTLPPSGDFVPASSPPSPSTPSSAEKFSVVASSIGGFGVLIMMLFFM